MAIILVDENLV